jgi:hypothetical protein
MPELIPAPEPLGLPVPLWILVGFKAFGFFVHLIFMNLWVAGLPTALCLLKSKPRAAERLLHALPFFMAFGINAGIVPLLFLQTIYPQFFYPATILQAWFWFLIIPLLLVAYYAVYLASFGKFRVAATLTATVLLYLIGMMFSSAMTLTANPQAWPKIFLASQQGGAVHGFYLYFDREVILRFLLVVGMAFGTLAAYAALDASWFAKDETYKQETRNLALLYLLGVVVYGVGAIPYAPSVTGKLPTVWIGAAGTGLLIGAAAALSYRQKPNRVAAAALAATQSLVLLVNVIARQWVQISELSRWYDASKMPVRGEWGSLALFLATLLIALALLIWIGRIALRATNITAVTERKNLS